MKIKAKDLPTSLSVIRSKAAALAVMASEVLLMVLEDPVEAATPVAKAKPEPRIAGFKPTKSPAKRKGRPPMTEEQRAVAKTLREELAKEVAEAPKAAELLSKPQPVTRASLAAQNGQSYFSMKSED